MILDVLIWVARVNSLFFWLCWVFVAAQRLLARGGYPSPQCTGFSLRWLLLLECRLQAEGLSRCGAQAVAAPRQMESSQTRDRAHVPCISRLIRILCTTPGKSESKHFSEDSGGPHKWDWTNCQWTVVLALEHKYPNASQHLFSTMAYNFFLYDLLLPTQLTFPFSFFPSWLLW